MTRRHPGPSATTSSIAHAGGRAFAQASTARDFRIGLSLAVAVHLFLLIAAMVEGHSSRSRVGEKDAIPDTVNVDVVDASELEPSGAGQASESQPSTLTAHEDNPTTTTTDKPMQNLADIAGQLLKNGLPKTMSQNVTDGTAKKRKQQSDASVAQSASLGLDLTTPAMPTTSAVTRPAGITRSGENDEFGRGVIRALRRSMPAANGTTGRVTVRIFLSEDGNLSDLQLVQSSGNAALDQQVLFAVRLSSFPIPPAPSSAADRTFLVSYLYR